MPDRANDDRILPLTRLVAAIVIPFLVLAFLILYLLPESSGERFAWTISPPVMAMFMGAGYLGGAWLFAQVAIGRRWHRVATGFLPVTAFTSSMLLATIVHWDRFDLNHFPFQLWLVLYLVTPVVVPWLWWRNRRADIGATEPGDQVVPAPARYVLLGLGVVLLGFSIVGFAAPATITAIWPWQLSPLTARVLSGWLALLGVGGLVMGRESRWSSWSIGLQTIGLWQTLVLIAMVLRPADLTSGLLNWYTLSVALVLAGMAGLYVTMERRRRRARGGYGQHPAAGS